MTGRLAAWKRQSAEPAAESRAAAASADGVLRVAIAGAGAVGRSVAHDLHTHGHKVLLIERQRAHYRPALVPEVDWLLADACELTALQAAAIDTCDAVVAATGDDRVNLVFAMLAKKEFGVARVVARINDPANQWLFSTDWGVDVAVSTPGTLAAIVDRLVPGLVPDVQSLVRSQRTDGAGGTPEA